MNIFGIGTAELVFIAILVLIFVGPGNTVKSMRTVGTWLRKARDSNLWKALQRMWELPAELAEEAGLEEFVGKPVGGSRRKPSFLEDDFKKASDGINKAWNMGPTENPQSEAAPENTPEEPEEDA